MTQKSLDFMASSALWHLKLPLQIEVWGVHYVHGRNYGHGQGGSSSGNALETLF